MINAKLPNHQTLIYQNILSSVSNAIVSLDFSGKVITFNEAAVTMLGVTQNKVLGQSFADLFASEQNHDFVDVFVHVIFTKEANFYKEVEFSKPDDSKIMLGITCSLLTEENAQQVGIVAVLADLTEARKRQFLEETLSRYLTQQVVSHILENPDSLTLDGEQKEVTILFADIRDFTKISEQIPPTELIDMLRGYFTLMVGAIFQHEGTVDKFIGDSIMAIFGAPYCSNNHAASAIKSSLLMLNYLESFNEARLAENKDAIKIGIGICTGTVTVGNIGSHDRFEYTAIGDSVNTASRLEGLTKLYHTPIVVAETTCRAAGENFPFRELDLVKVKGKNKPIRIFSVLN